jgi:hypothetical protein
MTNLSNVISWENPLFTALASFDIHPLGRRVWIFEKALQRITDKIERSFFFDVLGHA